VVSSATAPPALKRDAWLHLARIAEHQDNETRAAECYRQAAEVR
jgi:Tfp pilus assembly protein PilF